jgi:ABC-type multidrug transport system fused ATPase/permease subunit
MKLFKILSKIQKQKLSILLILVFVGMLLESMSIGVLLPILDILINPDNSEYLDFINTNFSFIQIDLSDQTLFISILILIVFTFKTIYLIYLNYRQNRFVSNVIKNISDRLFDSYIFRDINFHLNTNSAEIIRNLQSEIHNFTVYLQSLISIVIELALILAILIFILFYDPISSIVSFIFIFLIIFSYYKVLKNRMVALGGKRQGVALENNKIIIESLNGIKDIKILNLAQVISNLFKRNSSKIANINVWYYTLSQLPRYLLEIISIYGIFLLLSIQYLRGFSSSEIIQVLGIFIVGIFRVIPSVNKVITGLQNLKYSSPSLSVLFNNLKYKETGIEKKIIPFNDELVLKSIDFSYGEKLILKNINLTINKKETVLITGESGSGKSTLIDIISGLQKPSLGEIYLDGTIVDEFSYFKTGYVPQKIFFSDSTIKENIAFGIEKEKISDNKVWDSLKKAQLDKFVLSLKNGIETNIGENGLLLSGGQQQRIGLARAFYFDPELLILDESTSSLDKKIENEIFKTLEFLKNEMTMIIISHNHERITFFDKKFIINNGKLTQVI